MNGTVMTSRSEVAEFRAAGTDLSERRRSGVSRGPLIDLERNSAMTGIGWRDNGAADIGALVSVAAIAADPRIAAGYPGLAAAAQGLATPQIRHLATLGGNLAQRTRCWYFRNPAIDCFKKGGEACPARTGNHLYSVAFDLGPCVAPHPSTLAAALLAYDATVVTDRRTLSIPQLLGDGSDASADNQLAPGEIITRIKLPPQIKDERARYKRAISRSHAEWPLVEVIIRAVISDGVCRLVRITAGGIAPVPLRLYEVETMLNREILSSANVAIAAARSAASANPLPMTGYKLDLLRGLVTEFLEEVAR